VSTYTFTNVTANHTISASFALKTYTITATAGTGGSIAPSGSVSINHGASQTFTIMPNAGYRVADVSVDGVSAGAVTSYTFANVTSGHTISASFALITYTLTASAGMNGTITPAGAIVVNSGANQTFTIAPATGYHVADVLVDGTSVGAVTAYTFSNVTANHAISASFAINIYSVTASAGANGTITPSGATTVNYGASQTFTIAPAAGYHITDVQIDSVSAGAISTYTFTTVTANHTISASFAANTYSLTVAKSGTGAGTVTSSPAGISCGSTCSATYNAGTIVTLTAAPDTSSTFAGWSGACTGTAACSITMDAAKTVTASFALKSYTITATAGTGGSITPSGSVSVNHGASQTFTITPNTGYTLSNVLVDGVSVGSLSTYTFTTVTANHTISASFALKTYTITATAGAGGSITPSGSVLVNHGASQAFTITPNTGYTLSNVLVDGVSVGAVSTYTFTNVTAGHTVNASFGINTYNLTVSKAGTGTGTVTSSPSGISCGSTCSATYTGGTIVTLTATSDSSSTFTGWSGACTGTGACSVTLNAAKTVSAAFTLKTYTITATAGSGGTITPAGSLTVNHGSNGTFIITPNAGYALSNVVVDGVSVGAVSTYTFANVTADHSITASFAVNMYSLTVSKTGTGAGTVTSTPAGISCGTSCRGTYAAGTEVTLTASPASSSLFNGWSGACTGAGACMVTMDSAKTVYPLFTLKPEFLMSCSDAGIPCVERVGGGNDADNLVNGKPKADVEYEFRVVVKDTSGTPQSVRLLTAQRSTPQPGELAVYPLTCSGDFGTGAICSFRTKLGPAAMHRFFFDATMSDGTTVMRYPQTGLLNGPTVKLLTGYNLLGAPRVVNAAGLDGLLAFNSASTYRWNPDLGYYTQVTTVAPVKAGEGYFSYNASNVLPELAAFPDMQATEYAWPVKTGWNVVSNPYTKNVRLADIRVRRGTAAPVSWLEATANGWITNALYTYTGRDWGNTYSWESDATAVLAPWMGYSVHLNRGDATYSLIIPKP
jgi:hypothetical protein